MPNFTDQLRQLMQVCHITSFRALGAQAGVSKRTLNTLRQGQAELVKYQDLYSLSQVLKISVPQLIQTFSQLPTKTESTEAIRAEYERLQMQMAQQRRELQVEFEQAVIQQLESWLLQWPSAVYAAQNNPSMPARNLIPLVRPIEELLKKWGIEAIASVGETVAYNPQIHQLINAETVTEGESVIVRYVGYRQGEKLLYRARVSLNIVQ